MQKSTTDAVSNSVKPKLHAYRCNSCGSPEQVKLFEVERQKRIFAVVQCRCGLVYQNPRPKPEEFNDYYDRDYFEGEKKEFTSWQEFPTDLTERVIDLPPIDFNLQEALSLLLLVSGCRLRYRCLCSIRSRPGLGSKRVGYIQVQHRFRKEEPQA